MIIKGSSHTGRGLGIYLQDEKNERVEVWAIRGDMPRDLTETLDDWRRDAQTSHCSKPLYHAQLSPDRVLSREEWDEAIVIFEKEMGFENQPRAAVLHEYKDREHLHLVYSRMDEQGLAISDSWNYLHHEKASREIERTLGMEKIQGAFIDRDGERPERAPDHADMQQGERLKIDPHEVKAEVSALYQNAETGREFVTALEAESYDLARGDRRAYVILDEAGGVHSLARAAGVKVADLKEFMHEYPLEQLPSVDAVREMQRERLEAQRQAVPEIKPEPELEGMSREELDKNFDLDMTRANPIRVVSGEIKEFISQEEIEKRHNAHLAATLYSRGEGMVNQQRDAMKDHAERQNNLNEAFEIKDVQDWCDKRAELLAQKAPGIIRTPKIEQESGATITPEPDQQGIIEAFYERQRAGIVDPELDQAAAQFMPPEEFARAKHEAETQNENQKENPQEESQGLSTAQPADLSGNKEITQSRAARLAAAEKYFEKHDAELAERLEQGKDLGDGLELDLYRK